jgi:hypothetical protein
MTVKVYEFDALTEQGEPMHPAPLSTTLSSGGTVTLDDSTLYVILAASAASYAAIGASGGSATSADFNLEAGKSYGFCVDHTRPVHVTVADAA